VTGRPDVLFSEAELRARVAALGVEIAACYPGQPLCVVGLAKNCPVFMADLIRAIPLDLYCLSLHVTHGPSGPWDIMYSAQLPYQGRHVLLVDDVVDTGVTLAFLLDHIRELGPRSLRSCVLIDKRRERKVEVPVDWAAFTLAPGEDRFLVGYGLDFQERFRGLPYIGAIPRRSSPGGDAQVALGSEK
jgi:hypoxanthine phosphoribosyltransferase